MQLILALLLLTSFLIDFCAAVGYSCDQYGNCWYLSCDPDTCRMICGNNNVAKCSGLYFDPSDYGKKRSTSKLSNINIMSTNTTDNNGGVRKRQGVTWCTIDCLLPVAFPVAAAVSCLSRDSCTVKSQYDSATGALSCQCDMYSASQGTPVPVPPVPPTPPPPPPTTPPSENPTVRPSLPPTLAPSTAPSTTPTPSPTPRPTPQNYFSALNQDCSTIQDAVICTQCNCCFNDDGSQVYEPFGISPNTCFGRSSLFNMDSSGTALSLLYGCKARSFYEVSERCGDVAGTTSTKAVVTTPTTTATTTATTGGEFTTPTDKATAAAPSPPSTPSASSPSPPSPASLEWNEVKKAEKIVESHLLITYIVAGCVLLFTIICCILCFVHCKKKKKKKGRKREGGDNEVGTQLQTRSRRMSSRRISSKRSDRKQ